MAGQVIKAIVVDRSRQLHGISVLHVVVVVQLEILDRHCKLSWQLSLLSRAAFSQELLSKSHCSRLFALDAEVNQIECEEDRELARRLPVLKVYVERLSQLKCQHIAHHPNLVLGKLLRLLWSFREALIELSDSLVVLGLGLLDFFELLGQHFLVKSAINVVDSVDDLFVDEVDRLFDSCRFLLQDGKFLKVTLIGAKVQRIPRVRLAILVVFLNLLWQLVLLVLARIDQGADDWRSAVVEEEVELLQSLPDIFDLDVGHLLWLVLIEDREVPDVLLLEVFKPESVSDLLGLNRVEDLDRQGECLVLALVHRE